MGAPYGEKEWWDQGARILSKLHQIHEGQERVMAQLDDLKQAVADVKAAVDAEIVRLDAVIAALKAGPAANDPVVAQAIIDLQATKAKLDSAT